MGLGWHGRIAPYYRASMVFSPTLSLRSGNYNSAGRAILHGARLIATMPHRHESRELLAGIASGYGQEYNALQLHFS